MADIDVLRRDALRLAVFLHSRWQHDADDTAAVLRTAGEFTIFLTAPAAALTVGEPVIAAQADPAHHLPLQRTGADMAVTMTDTDQATYPAATEDDSRGFPVTGDTITVTESSAGAVVALTQNADGSATFAAVAPGTATVSWTDGTLSFTDTITVDPGAAASLVIGAPVIEPIPAPPAP